MVHSAASMLRQSHAPALMVWSVVFSPENSSGENDPGRDLAPGTLCITDG